MNQEDKEKQLRAILVSGYAWSGSSAVMDLLKELKGYKHFEPELRLLTDPGGIIDLENAIVQNKSYTVVDHTIKHFKILIRVYSRNFHWWRNFKISRMFERIGFNYNKYMKSDFNQISEEYLRNLIGLEYNGDLITDFYNLGRVKFFITKFNLFLHKLIKKKVNSSNKIYFSSKSEDEFLKLTRRYLDNVCHAIIEGEDISNVVFDQGVQPYNAIRGMRYFNSVKTIVVDRDPRDIFTQTYDFIFNTSIPNRDIDQFIEWYKLTRRRENDYFSSKDVLFIQFEELILNYEKVIDLIFNFLDESSNAHVKKNMYLKPKESKRNIGLWQDFRFQNYIRKIETELKEYCWEK